MSKNNKIERVFYILINLAFIFAGLFKIIIVPDAGGSFVYASYYTAVFTDQSLGIYGNIFLAVPFVCAVVNICLVIAEIGINKIHQGIEQAFTSFTIMFFAFGLLFASISENLVPFGIIILVLTVLTLLVRIIFYYGVKKMKI